MSAEQMVSQMAQLFKVQIELRGWTARDLAERAFYCCKEMGHRIPASAIIKASAKHFGVAPEDVMKTSPHSNSLFLIGRKS